MISAWPPGLSTRCISFRARSGSEKFLNAARQTMKSTEFAARGMSEALPWRNWTWTPSFLAYSEAMRTKLSLMSSPVISKGPSLASATDKKPGPGATSRTLAPLGSSAANSLRESLEFG